MGVANLWDLVKFEDAYARVPFRRFVIDFQERHHNRSPRIAIDGYLWMYECGFFSGNGKTHELVQPNLSKAILNLLTKIKEMLITNVTFVVVFDGVNKPYFKWNNNTTHHDNENSYNEFMRQYMYSKLAIPFNSGYQPSFMNIVTQLFDELKISYIIAPAEGEAQCCWLQTNSIVDFVMTNDSDILLFGGTRILRNVSRATEDKGPTNSPSKYNTMNKEYFVTVIDLGKLSSEQKQVKLNKKVFLLYSVLTGADYSKGLRGIGKKKALSIAQSESPDFSAQFSNIFDNLNDKSYTDIDKQYSKFKNDLRDYCKKNSSSLFGMNYRTLDFQDWPSIIQVCHYFHPLVDNKLFDWARQASENSSTTNTKGYQNINFKKLYELLETMNLPNVIHFNKWFHNMIHEMFITKFIAVEGTYEHLKVVEDKYDTDAGLAYLRIRYRTFLPHVKEPKADDVSPRKTTQSQRRRISSPTRRQKESINWPYSIWIPRDLLPKEHCIISDYENQQRSSRSSSKSPNKRKFANYYQANTLDTFLSAHSSPIKKPLANTPNLAPVKRRLFVSEEEALAEPLINNTSIKYQKVEGIQARHTIVIDSDSDGDTSQ